MAALTDPLLNETLLKVAPGTPLREGLERILRGRTGALIVLGDGKPVEAISNGGFSIDTEFTPARLRELAKMDGAIVLSKDAQRINSAAVHLMPVSDMVAAESGTRHRTAQHTSLVTGSPVITVSASMNIIALFVNGERYALDRPELILERANQALNTLERYRERLESVMHHLTSQEIEATVTIREVASAVQRQEMVRRITTEISSYALELGVEGRLVTLQLEELASGTEGNTELLLRDYSVLRSLTTSCTADVPPSLAFLADKSLSSEETSARQMQALSELSSAELVDLGKVAAVLGVSAHVSLDQVIEPQGHRILSQIRNLPRTVSERIVDQFGGLQGLLAATTDELLAVEGVGEQRARGVRETLTRMSELNFLERY